MQQFKFHRNDLHLFGEQHVKMVYEQSRFSTFIHRPFEQAAFEAQIQEKANEFSAEKRSVLVKALREQYQGITGMENTSALIESLKDENTFTVTTGHQLSLLTGPLFFVIKILQTIKQAELLNQKYPEQKFVPVYWMATEDHDFEEIQKTHLFSEEIIWESLQSGPVGRFDLDGLNEVKNRVSELFGNHPESEIHDLLNEYAGSNLAEATRKLVHRLFQGFDLVIIDGDDANLKQLFAPIMRKELESSFALSAVTKTNEELEKVGGKAQVFARDINLFYIEKGLRSRIERKNDGFIVEGKGDFSTAQILSLLENQPECFSPNVVLRPVYQECILPNLAYIGGGGEIAYWLQLKGVFDSANVLYPLINIRNSVLIIDQNTHKKIENTLTKLSDIFEPIDSLKREYVEANAGEELSFDDLDIALSNLGNLIVDQITQVDPGMDKFAAAEVVRLEKQIESIKDKLVKRSKGKHEAAMKQIEQIKERLFPNGSLQERTSNVFSFCPDGNYSGFLHSLYEGIQPDEKDFIVFVENMK